MPFFTWSAEYNMGIREVDEQHKRLVSLVNEVHEAMSAGEAPEVARRVLQELIDYTREHFSSEERLMRESGFPELDHHIAEHQRLTREVEDMQAGRASNPQDVSAQLPGFLRGWLVNHIIDEDMEYARYIARQRSWPAASMQ